VESSTTWQLGERTLHLKHLDKLYWPEDGLTKRDLLAYYRDLAPVFLPYFADRPVTLRVFPEGIHGPSFYRRDLPDDAPPWLRHVDYHAPTAGRVVDLPLIDDVAGVIWLANAGAIEFHLWSARLPDLAEPDQAIFDLDPGEHASFRDVLQAAVHLREALEQVGLRGYAKTSGGRGLHVYLPLAPGHTYKDVRAWVKGMATALAAANPQSIAVPRGATHRGQHVTIDYAQNSIGRNTAAPYTVRALPGAPVSTPLTWDEVAAGEVRPSDLTLRTVPARVQERGDLFAPVLGRDQRLPPLGEA
jgi:bifunctional non-homologous end joining protein LigD